jgi:hypothetical protein
MRFLKINGKIKKQMKKNLIIAPAGDNSLFIDWLGENQSFDVCTIYFGDSDEIFNEYKKNSKFCIKNKGQKWHLIYSFIKENINNISQYDFFWFPDDDLKTNVNDINTIFEISKKYDLELCQPSMTGHVSYQIERKVENSLLRFTSFVEIICPMMSKNTCFNLLETFIINESGWGLDYLWPKLLGYSQDKIAIIDKVEVEHTRPVGSNYSNRFKKEPMQELNELFRSHNLGFYQTVYKTILL